MQKMSNSYQAHIHPALSCLPHTLIVSKFGGFQNEHKASKGNLNYCYSEYYTHYLL